MYLNVYCKRIIGKSENDWSRREMIRREGNFQKLLEIIQIFVIIIKICISNFFLTFDLFETLYFSNKSLLFFLNTWKLIVIEDKFTKGKSRSLEKKTLNKFWPRNY